MENQPELFSDTQEPRLTSEEAAAHIARTARPVEYEDRTSEAAHDQGWGPVEPQAQSATLRKQPRLFEMPGQNRGRNNPDNEPLSRAEILAGLSPEEIASRDAANKAGVAAVREALKHGHFGRVGGH